MCTKVPGRPPLINQQITLPLEDSTHPTKKVLFIKKSVRILIPSHRKYFMTLMRGIPVLCITKFKKLLMQLTQNNPLLNSTSEYKPKYLPFDYPMH